MHLPLLPETSPDPLRAGNTSSEPEQPHRRSSAASCSLTRLKQHLPKAASGSMTERLHLVRCRDPCRCLPADVPAACWLYPSVTVKALGLAAGQATCKSVRWWEAHLGGTGECCTAGAFPQAADLVLFLTLLVSIRHLLLPGKLGMLRNGVSKTKPLFVHRTAPSSLDFGSFPYSREDVLQGACLSTGCRESIASDGSQCLIRGGEEEHFETRGNLSTALNAFVVIVFLANICCCAEHPALCSPNGSGCVGLGV